MAKIFNDANNASYMVGNERDSSCPDEKNISLVKELGSSNKYTKGEQNIIYSSINEESLIDDEELFLIPPVHNSQQSKEIVSAWEYETYKPIYDFLDRVRCKQDYKIVLCNIFVNMPLHIKLLYVKYADRLVCLSVLADKALFFPMQGFVVNQDKDLHNELGAGNSFIHESAHQLAYEMVADGLLPKTYGLLLRGNVWKDYNLAISSIKEQDIHTNEEKSRNSLTKELELNDIIANTVSDVFGGITKNKVCGFYIHKYSTYWKRDKSLVGVECFADITADLVCGNPSTISFINQYLPNTMIQYNKLLNGAIL
jgi:hypothetical protein